MYDLREQNKSLFAEKQINKQTLSAFIASAINHVTLKDCAGRGKGPLWNSTAGEHAK